MNCNCSGHEGHIQWTGPKTGLVLSAEVTSPSCCFLFKLLGWLWSRWLRLCINEMVQTLAQMHQTIRGLLKLMSHKRTHARIYSIAETELCLRTQWDSFQPSCAHVYRLFLTNWPSRTNMNHFYTEYIFRDLAHAHPLSRSPQGPKQPKKIKVPGGPTSDLTADNMHQIHIVSRPLGCTSMPICGFVCALSELRSERDLKHLPHSCWRAASVRAPHWGSITLLLTCMIKYNYTHPSGFFPPQLHQDELNIGSCRNQSIKQENSGKGGGGFS